MGGSSVSLSAMFMRYGLGMAGVGVTIGLTAAGGIMRLLTSLLFGVTPLDPLTYTVVPVVLAAAALASYIPARRAAAVDPIEALRTE